MSRGMATRRRGLRAQTWVEESSSVESIVDEAEQRAERLDAENARLRDELAEAEGWYRLLQADHASLQHKHEQVGCKVGKLQSELDRLESRNQELEAVIDRPVESRRTAGSTQKEMTMIRINEGFRSLRRHKWASAALVALVTLLARDPGVQGLFNSAVAKVRDLGNGNGADRDRSNSGFVLYAAMIQARDEAEKARADYNERESMLKGDALLESQDQVRSAKARYRQARLAFLPELARQCDQVKLPVPKEASEALALLKQETRD
jgi:hypothetical protein